jgi:phospholipase C
MMSAWLELPVLSLVAATCACGSSSGAPAKRDAGPDSASGASIPIKHVVVIVKENHTFDNYFGAFPGAEGTLKTGGQNMCSTPQGSLPCKSAPDAPAHDLCHGHDCGLVDWDDGKMDGWSNSGGSDTGDGLAYAQYGEADIPNYWAYARKFVLADHFFAGMIGPSMPGHMFTVAAQAGWATGNPPSDSGHPYWGCDEKAGDTCPILMGGTTPAQVFPCFNIPSIPDVLPAGVDWKYYGTNFDGIYKEVWSAFDSIAPIRNDAAKWSHVVLAAQFTSDVKNHTLPIQRASRRLDPGQHHPDRRRMRRRGLDGRLRQSDHAVGLLERDGHSFHDGRLRWMVRPRSAATAIRRLAVGPLWPRLSPSAPRHFALRQARLRLQRSRQSRVDCTFHREGVRGDEVAP